MDMQGISRVSFNTTMAACSAGLTAIAYGYFRTGKWDLGWTTNGFLAGLVAITCPCYWVSPTGSFFIGIVAAFVMIWAMDGLEYLRVDDPIGAVPVHLANGIWGTLSLGLFATGQFGLPTPTGMDASVSIKGLFYGGGSAQLLAQATGSGAVVIATLLASIVLMYAVKATGTLRVSREGELEGLDLHEHGMLAYPEYVIHGYGSGPTPAGLSSAMPSPVAQAHTTPSRART
jgi:Amt family ammonium transporter